MDPLQGNNKNILQIISNNFSNSSVCCGHLHVQSLFDCYDNGLYSRSFLLLIFIWHYFVRGHTCFYILKEYFLNPDDVQIHSTGNQHDQQFDYDDLLQITQICINCVETIWIVGHHQLQSG